MTKTLALLLDSYRELNSKKLFWIVLGLSGIVVVIFGALGLDGGAVTFFGWTSPLKFPYLSLLSHATFYKILFAKLGIDIWLSWLAMILALISTAGIFPDFMAGGSIDLYLSKPIARLRLFITKYIGALLFVTLQVSIFTVACFVLLGWRGRSWEPSLFLAIPTVVLVFSYLFAICVLLGVLTRSTIAALLITLLVWLIFWALQLTEVGLLQAMVFDQQRAAMLDRRIAATQLELDRLGSAPATQQSAVARTTAPPDARADDAKSSTSSWWGWLPGGSTSRPAKLRAQLADEKAERAKLDNDGFVLAHTIAYWVTAPLPKTSGTIELLSRQLVKLADLPKVEDPQPAAQPVDLEADQQGVHRDHRRDRGDEAASARELDVELRGRSSLWILGTSCAFEAVILGLAAWLFCRRDY